VLIGLAFLLFPLLNFKEYSVSHTSNRFRRILHRIGLIIDLSPSHPQGSKLDGRGEPTSGILNDLEVSMNPALKHL
jgi:hypothetical protein